MADDPLPEVTPQTAPPAQSAGIGKRRLLIKAALIGSTVPVVATISRSAFAAHVCNEYGTTHLYTRTGVMSNGNTVSRCYSSDP